MTRAEIVFSLIMLFLIGGMTLLAFSYPPETRLSPLIIGIPATILCIVNVISVWRGRAAEPSKKGTFPVRGEVAAVLWFLGFVLGIVLLGFYVGAPFLVFLYCWLSQRTSLLAAAIAALLMWLLLYGVFTMALEQILFGGILFDRLA